MKHDPTERWIQDYVDGRLNDEERAAAEIRLRQDAGLARRVESLRRIGEALREGGEELPPGFHERARRRFEREAAQGRRVPLSLLSWESLGLAVAAVVVLAVFLPPVLRQDTPTRPPAPRPARPVTEDPRRSPDAAPSRMADDDALEKEERAADDGVDAGLASPSKEPVERSAEEAGRARGRSQLADAPAVAERQLLQEAPAAAAPEVAPPPPAPPAPLRSKRIASEKKRLEGDLAMTDAADARVSEMRADAPPREPDSPSPVQADRFSPVPPESSPLLTVVDLPGGLLAPGHQLHIVEQRDEWDRLLRGPGGEALARLGPKGFSEDAWAARDRPSRLVLVGPREPPYDCSAIRVVTTEAGYEIRLPREPASAGTTGGCGFVLPQDGRPVAVIDLGRDDR